MSALEQERQEVISAFEDVERIEGVARALDEELRTPLIQAAHGVLSRVPPVRTKIASELLSLSEKTVQAWTVEGVLTPAAGDHARTLLDPERLHDVLHLVTDLRAAGKKRGLLDAVWRRLQDQALLDRPDLQESLEQMRRGEVVEL
jgi:hypothetical protein